MFDDPNRLRLMAAECRAMASTRDTEELRNIFLAMARRYDSEALAHEDAAPRPIANFEPVMRRRAS